MQVDRSSIGTVYVYVKLWGEWYSSQHVPVRVEDLGALWRAVERLRFIHLGDDPGTYER